MSEEKYEIVRFIDGELELEVNISPNEETIWLTQEQIVELFYSTKQNISFHINNILDENELDYSTVKEILTVRIEGNRKVKRKIKYYNLDMIISVGYRVNSKRGIKFRKWANKILKEYLLKGYVINEERTLVTNEKFLRLINKVDSLDEKVHIIENKFKTNEVNISQILYNGQFYDAYTLIQQIFESANNEIIIIDNYVDRTVLDRLIVKKNNVKVTIYTSITSRLLGKDIDLFNKQYGKLEVKYTTKVHDRYIIIDQTKLYHLGHSIKDLGKKICSISESDSLLIKELINNLEQIN